MRRARLRHRLLLALASLALTLGGLEAVARVRWRAPWYERLRTEQAASQELVYRENRLGLRDADYPADPAPGRRRVLVLGDSFTYGLGVADDDAVFCALLERELDRAPPAGTTGVDVLNGGIPGSLTTDWAALWQRAVPAFQPDVVLVVFFLRDGTEMGTQLRYFDQIRELLDSGIHDRWPYRWCYLYRMFQDQRDRRTIGRAYAQQFHRAYRSEDPKVNRQWRVARRNLRRMRGWAEEQGITLALAVFPILVQLEDEAGYPFREEERIIREFSEQLGLPTLDLLPAFLGQDAPDLWVSAADQHPNAAGHRIAAAALLPFVRALVEAAAPAAADTPADHR